MNKTFLKKNFLKNRWLLSYADFVTMLLVLFMALYAISQTDINKMQKLKESLQGGFIIQKAEDSQIKRETLQEINKLNKQFKTTKVTVNVLPATYLEQDDILLLQKKLKDLEQEMQKDYIVLKDIKNTVETQLKEINGLKLKQDARGLIISFPDDFMFKEGSADIIKTARSKLDTIAKILHPFNYQLRVEGYTDNRPIKSIQYPSNWELSTARAINVVKYLVKEHKFTPTRLSAAGYGEYNPIAENNSEEGRKINRRVEIVVLSAGGTFANMLE